MKLTQILTLLVVFLFLSISVIAQTTFIIDVNMKNVIAKYEGSELTNDNLKSALIKMHIKHPNEVFNQCVIESGHFKSKLAIYGHNLFGMRKSSKRLSFALRKKKYGYAQYKSWIYSVADYKLWQNMVQMKKNETYKQYCKRRHYNVN